MADTAPLFDPVEERLDSINENLSLISLRRGLTFGTDSYLLAAFAHAHPSGNCVELGGGTGVVSLLAASRKKYRTIFCAEIQEIFARLIERNAELNGLGDVVRPICADIRDLSPADTGWEAHAVLSNPPYMRAESGRQNTAPEMNAARREENGTIDDFCAAASRLLRHGGYFTTVFRPDRLSELFFSMTKHGIEPKRVVLVHPSPSDKPCLVLTEGKRGAAPGLVFSRPLFIYEDGAKTTYTGDMQAIYDTFSLEHLF